MVRHASLDPTVVRAALARKYATRRLPLPATGSIHGKLREALCAIGQHAGIAKELAHLSTRFLEFSPVKLPPCQLTHQPTGGAAPFFPFFFPAALYSRNLSYRKHNQTAPQGERTQGQLGGCVGAAHAECGAFEMWKAARWSVGGCSASRRLRAPLLSMPPLATRLGVARIGIAAEELSGEDRIRTCGTVARSRV